MRLFAATFAALSYAASAAADDRGSTPPTVAPPDVQLIAPALGVYTDRVLFGDVWKRTELAPRDRSLITVATLIAGGHTRQLPSHLKRALDNGVKPSEISEIITHLAFYAGWPNAISAVSVAKDVFEERGIHLDQPAAVPIEPASANQAALEIRRSGSEPSTNGSPDYFTGTVRIDQRFQRSDPARVGGASVTFEPGARTAWHTHPLGQTLIVTAGCGWVQREGGPVEEIRPGDVVLIPPAVKHWHGATAATAMTHIAIAEAKDGKSVDWMEQVSDADYQRGSRSQNGCSIP